MTRIYHIATAEDWAAARSAGSYRISTRGRTLDEVGFIHASYRDQVASVFGRFYRGVREPLVLLTIETDKLTAPWREETVDDETFPHVYGELNPPAVVDVQPLDRRGGTPSFMALFFGEMLHRMVPVLLAMLVVAMAVLVGRQYAADWGALAGAVAGVAAFVMGYWLWRRLRG